MKKRAQKGFILLQVFLGISVLCLIVLSSLQLMLLQLKAFNHLTKTQKSFHQLEKMAEYLRHHHQQLPSDCFRKGMNPNAMRSLVKKEGCVIANKMNRYAYLIEDLGVYACLQTIKHNVPYSTRHWRLTLLSLIDDPLRLQLRFAEYAPFIPCHGGESIVIQPGWLSWRYG